jgi:hypothetical protein
VFFIDAAIGDRHIESGEFGHFGAQGYMFIGEGGLLHVKNLGGKSK